MAYVAEYSWVNEASRYGTRQHVTMPLREQTAEEAQDEASYFLDRMREFVTDPRLEKVREVEEE